MYVNTICKDTFKDTEIRQIEKKRKGEKKKNMEKEILNFQM